MMLDRIPFVFFGTPHFAAMVLDELEKAGFLPSLIVSAPDKPAGRKLKLTPPPVKVWAEARSIDILQPEKLNDAVFQKLTGNYKLGVVAAYGLIIPKKFIDSFPRGLLNVHPSLLPKYRGPSPIQSQILADEQEVGVTIMLLDEKMDHGPIIRNQELGIRNQERLLRASELEAMLAREGGKLLAELIPKWMAGEIEAREQDHAQATFTKKITKEDGLITLEEIAKKPYETFLKICAYDEWPGTYFFLERKGKRVRVKIKDAVFENGILKITRVVPEGGRETNYENIIRD